MALYTQQTQAVNTAAINGTAGVALAANPARTYWHIQNVGTNPVFVNLGGTASATVYHVVLKGGTGASDGLGAFFAQSGSCVFTGAITFAGTSPSIVVCEHAA